MKRILFVEENKDLRELYHSYFQQYYHVDSFASGEEALSNFSPEKYDLLVTDYTLVSQKMGGLELIQGVKERNYTGKILIISSVFPRILEVPYEHLYKPLSFREIQKTIERLLA